VRIVICGAGEVGTAAAERLARGGQHDLVLIDRDAERLGAIADRVDLTTVTGDAARSTTLAEARIDRADLLVAATERDEVNLAIAALSRRLGARRVIARVHDSALLAEEPVDYADLFGVDRFVCPELAAGEAVAAAILSPAALAVETIGGGAMTLQELRVFAGSAADGAALSELGLPEACRIVAIVRDGRAELPVGTSVLRPGDAISVAGLPDAVGAVARRLGGAAPGRRRVVFVGATAITRFAAEQLLAAQVAIRVFEPDRRRAERFAAGAPDGVEVLAADPTEEQVFVNESLESVDAVVTAGEDEEDNILSAAWFRTRGIPTTAAIVIRPTYLRLLGAIGVGTAISPRRIAAAVIAAEADPRPVRIVHRFGGGDGAAGGRVELARVRVTAGSSITRLTLGGARASVPFVVAAIERGGLARVPAASERLEADDMALVAYAAADHRRVAALFLARDAIVPEPDQDDAA
jgi:trk system potassium uptake protein TrkA